MKTIGLLEGMSWESTELYYRAINKAVSQRLGGYHSAKICMVSVDFHDLEHLQHEGRWQEIGALLAADAQNIEKAGADVLVVCTNTMHKVAHDIEAAIRIPLLHIADATGDTICQSGVKTVGLLGTQFTMEHDFYKGRLESHHGLGVIVPDDADRAIVHNVIYDELCFGRITDSSRQEYVRIINTLVDRGTEAIILGCTEIALLVTETDTPIPLFDTTAIHADAAVAYALS